MKKALFLSFLAGILSLPISGYANSQSMSCVGYTANQEMYVRLLISQVDEDSSLGRKGIIALANVSIGRTIEHSKPFFEKTYKIVPDFENEGNGIDVRGAKVLTISEVEDVKGALNISGRDIRKLLKMNSPLLVNCQLVTPDSLGNSDRE